MVQPLNIRTIKSAVEGSRQYVQDEKIQIARRTITRFQYADRWPDDYNSFVTSEKSGNLYKDPSKFFRVMHYKPQWYARKFIFRPRAKSSSLIRQATLEAYSIIINQTRQIPSITGLYGSSFKVMLDGKLLSNIRQLDSLNDDSITKIVNTAPYAGAMEKNKLYFSSLGGVIYYAAQTIKRKYPQLGVRFVYERASAIQGTNHKYDVPVLSIGTRTSIIDKISKPGKNHRRRDRIRRSKRNA